MILEKTNRPIRPKAVKEKPSKPFTFTMLGHQSLICNSLSISMNFFLTSGARLSAKSSVSSFSSDHLENVPQVVGSDFQGNEQRKARVPPAHNPNP